MAAAPPGPHRSPARLSLQVAIPEAVQTQ